MNKSRQITVLSINLSIVFFSFSPPSLGRGVQTQGALKSICRVCLSIAFPSYFLAFRDRHRPRGQWIAVSMVSFGLSISLSIGLSIDFPLFPFLALRDELRPHGYWIACVYRHGPASFASRSHHRTSFLGYQQRIDLILRGENSTTTRRANDGDDSMLRMNQCLDVTTASTVGSAFYHFMCLMPLANDKSR